MTTIIFPGIRRMYKEPGYSDVAGPKTVAETIWSYLKEEIVNKYTLKAAGLALAIALVPAAAKAIEVIKTDDVKIDLGARMQLLGTFRNSTSTDYVPNATGGTNRDFTEIYLFQNQNRLKLNADLQGVLFKFENAMGSEAYPGSNNLYTLYEMNAEIPVKMLGENTYVVAGLIRRPESVRDAAFDETLLFAGESELSNIFFNAGYDTGVYLKTRAGMVDGLLGVVQGVGNLPERYIPEKLNLPVPMIARFGFGNIEDSPDRVKQLVDKQDESKWRVGAGGFWLADSNAGHGDLFGQMATQAEATKGPFVNGNYMFSGKYYNPFMAAGLFNEKGALGAIDSQFWQANVNALARIPMGEATLVAGINWEVAQFIVKGLNNRPRTAAAPSGGVLINGKEYNYGQLTVQGGEAYLGYLADKWWAATRVSVLVPDALMGAYTGPPASVNGTSAFADNTLWEITFPALGYKINKFVTLTAELEHNLNAIEAIDQNGEYQLKTVPIESTLLKKYQPYQLNGRLQLQVAF